MTIREAAQKLRAGDVSSVELVEESLRSIREQQPRLNAFITVTEDLAFEQARRADKRLSQIRENKDGPDPEDSPLLGIPYALKDNFSTKGVRTTTGSKIFADHVPAEDCDVYSSLKEAGAVLMGKTGLHELAYGITSDNPHFGPIRNPRDPDRIPGGSSGGSAAAVAADMVFFALGSDTGGSIRIPASFCGCFGLKPTWGTVSSRGMSPLGFSLDHAGPLTRTAEDAALVMEVIAIPSRKGSFGNRQAPFDRQEANRFKSSCRIGIPENFYIDSLAPEVATAFEAAIRRAEAAGAQLAPVRIPHPAEINALSRVILLSEASALLEQYLDRRGDIGADVMALLDQGRLLSATDYINAQRVRRIYQREWARLYETESGNKPGVSCIFTPAAPIVAPRIGARQVEIAGIQEDVRLASTRFVRAINVLGLPAVSTPLPTDGMPIGLQIIGDRRSDGELIGVARLMQCA